MKKTLLALTFSISILYSSAQSWTTCNTSSGELSGTTKNIEINESTEPSVYSVIPAGTVPQNDFLIVLHDSLAHDKMGNSIIQTSSNGVISPASLGLTGGDTFSIVPFSYDLQQFKLLTQGLLKNSVPFLGSCCNVLSSQTTHYGFCDTLNSIGIMDSSDVNTLKDVINVISIYKYISIQPMSLKGLNDNLTSINSQINTLNSVGCSNGVNEICYAFDSLSSSHDQYAVNTITGVYQNNFGSDFEIYPNPSKGLFSVNLGDNFKTVTTYITDVNGIRVSSNSYNESQIINFNIAQPAGVYLLTIESEEKKATIRLIKN